MDYDPIKNFVSDFFSRSTFWRRLFYRLLDLLLLRTWHIHRELGSWKKTAPADAHILDAGSGFGQYSYYLSRQCKTWNVLAVDVKSEQVSDCNQFFNKIGVKNVVFRTADLTRFQAENSFDLALSVDVMEHILEDELVFRNIHNSLRTGGLLLISTPSDQGGSDTDEEHGESFIGEHVRNGYNIHEIEDKLHRSGFQKVEAKYSYGAPGKISWKLSMKYPIKVLGLSKFFIILLPVYFLFVYPICFVLNYFDSTMEHPTGTGLIVKAWKT